MYRLIALLKRISYTPHIVFFLIKIDIIAIHLLEQLIVAILFTMCPSYRIEYFDIYLLGKLGR